MQPTQGREHLGVQVSGGVQLGSSHPFTDGEARARPQQRFNGR